MPQTTRKLRPRVAARRRRGEAPSPTVTIEITEVETLPPQQQAAWDWLVRRVQAAIARQRQQQDSEVSDAHTR